MGDGTGVGDGDYWSIDIKNSSNQTICNKLSEYEKNIEYVFLFMGSNEWEDNIIILNKTTAIEKSKKHPNHRVEIFKKNNNGGYIPTYKYYKNVLLIDC